MRKEEERLWHITPSPPPLTYTPSPPRKRQRSGTGSITTAPACSTRGTLRATQHDAPDPPSSGAPA